MLQLEGILWRKKTFGFGHMSHSYLNLNDFRREIQFSFIDRKYFLNWKTYHLVHIFLDFFLFDQVKGPVLHLFRSNLKSLRRFWYGRPPFCYYTKLGSSAKKIKEKTSLEWVNPKKIFRCRGSSIGVNHNRMI